MTDEYAAALAALEKLTTEELQRLKLRDLAKLQSPKLKRLRDTDDAARLANLTTAATVASKNGKH